MIEKLEINKTDTEVKVFVKLKKKTTSKMMKMDYSWTNAKKAAEEKYPELKLDRPTELKLVIRNYDTDKLEESWTFPIKMQKLEQFVVQEEVKQEVKQEVSKELPRQNNSLSFNKKKSRNILTSQPNRATVDQTSQSDPPVIVQEPTE